MSETQQAGQIEKCVMIIAGEASGDLHGANLVKSIKEKNNKIFFFGIGGKNLKETGVRILMDSNKLSVVGITEVFSKISEILTGRSVAKQLLQKLKPDLLILIDFPDFNLNIAYLAKKFNISVLYYISPQIWAWRTGRVKKIKRRVKQMAVILPFEKDFYQTYDVATTYVGHPIMDSNPYIKNDINKSNQCNTIGLLPGSRTREVTTLLPIMLEAAKILLKKNTKLKFIISVAPTISEKIIKEIIDTAKFNNADIVKINKGNLHKLFEESDFIIAASGTVALEIAIAGIPMVIIYKVSSLSWLVARLMVKVKYACLVNLIAQKSIIPEFIQNNAKPENIANTVYSIIMNPRKFQEIKAELIKIRKTLGNKGASKKAADVALKMLYNK